MPEGVRRGKGKWVPAKGRKQTTSPVTRILHIGFTGK